MNGVNSLVAFKATDQAGNPVSVSGKILDNQEKPISNFSTSHNGMGTFSLTPAAGNTYKAVWNDKAGVKHESVLPTAKQQGLTLSVRQAGQSITYSLERSATQNTAPQIYTVLAQYQQQIVYSARINLTARPQVTAALPLDSILSGIIQLTVFNSDDLPVAERIFFLNNDNHYFNTDIHANEINPGRRKRNVLQVDVGGSIISNLSVSVTDEALSGPGKNRENILSSLLLTSDLRGYVYDPAYYFTSNEDSLKTQLDLVMLTNGWRRYKWEDMLAGKWPVIKLLPENGITVSGIVYGPSAFLLKDKEITGVFNSGEKNDVFTMPISPEGKFGVAGLNFYDSAKLYYQFNRDRNQQLTNSSSFSFSNKFAQANALPPAFLLNLPAGEQPDSTIAGRNKLVAQFFKQGFKEGNGFKSLSSVTVKANIKTKEQKLEEKYASGFFTSPDGYTFAPEDDPLARTSLTVLEYLQGKVAGLQINVSNNPTAIWRGNATSFFLNEMSADLSRVQAISMNDVAMIKVFRPPFFSSAGGGAGGAIAVYLKRGKDKEAPFKGMDFVKLTGYSSIKEFYAPDYDNPNGPVPENDVRSTLYWNPSIIMDERVRRVKIPFYNSDRNKKIRVVVEGINRMGQLTREEKVFE